MQRAIQKYNSQLERYSSSQCHHHVDKRHMTLTHRNHPITVTQMNPTTVLGIPETSKFPKKLLEKTEFESINLKEAFEAGLMTYKLYKELTEKGITSIVNPSTHIHFLGNSPDFLPIHVVEINREISPVLVLYTYKELGDKGEIELDLGTFKDYNERHNFIVNLIIKQANEKGYIIIYNLEKSTYKYYHSSEIAISENFKSEGIRITFETTDLKDNYQTLYAKLQANKPLEASKSYSLHEIIS